jgi:hypothetical protein
VASLQANAQESAGAQPAEHHEISKDTREKMAQLHEQLAACLRSDTPVQVCHGEMMKNCQQLLGNEGCRAAHGIDGRPRMRPNGTGTPPG